jgi:hypothetical protein
MKFNWSQYIDVADSLGKMANQREEGVRLFIEQVSAVPIMQHSM